MAGCFGNHPVDRYLENQLYDWLDKYYCEKCNKNITEDEIFEYKDDYLCEDCFDELITEEEE